MGKYCVAYNCTNNESKDACKGISFFRFPLKNKALTNAWRIKIRRLNFKPNESSRLCSDHFKVEDFTYQLFTHKRLLKPGAVPSVFSHIPKVEEANTISTNSSTLDLIQKRVCPSSLSTPSTFVSPVIQSSSIKKHFDVNNASIELLKQTIKEMELKNETLEKEICDLEEQGYKEEDYKWYIDKFHEYNDIKDVAQMVMGRVAILEQTTVKKIHEEFNVGEED